MIWPLHAEWTKQRTTATTGWLLLGTAVALAALGPAVVSSVDPAHCPPDGCSRDLVRTGLTGAWLAQATAALLGVLAATTEYATGTVTPTLTATPRRLRIVAAKAYVVAGVVVGASTAGVGAAFVTTRWIADRSALTPSAGFSTVDLASAATPRALGGTVLYLVAVALLGLGFGLLLRETAWATTTVFGLLYVGPLLSRFINNVDWNERLQQVSPTAGLSVQATLGLAALPIAPWPSLAVTWGHAVAAAAAGAISFTVRDD